MTEKRDDDNYIKCSKCRSKYINDDEHIKQDFGFNRLNKRFKTCVKCRSEKIQTNTIKLLDSAPIRSLKKLTSLIH